MLNTVIWGDGEPALFVHGSMSWSTDSFSEQRPLSDLYRLVLIDRRGYGKSPSIQSSDFEVDAQDIAELLRESTHLVGEGYGAIACLIAAGLRPKSVCSLAVIEPPTFELLRGDELIEQVIENQRHAYAQTNPEDFLHAYLGSYPDEPLPGLSLTQQEITAVRTAMTERPPWEARLPLAALADAHFPKLVASGDWATRFPLRRGMLGRVYNLVCDALAEQIGAERVVFMNAAQNPQSENPQAFNARLRALWEIAKQPGVA
jgi:pimeloyl-ACP methyl ester carboxylesterase